MTSAGRLHSGFEVLSDPTYLRVCRGVLSFRMLACILTAALTPTVTDLAGILLVVTTVLSAWGMLSDGFVRHYFRHPSLAAVDVGLVATIMVLEWPVTGALLITALSTLLIGLALNPWLGMPGLILILGSMALAGLESLGSGPARQSLAVLIGLPLTTIGMTALGWTIRYAFVELRRSRDLVMAETVARRHQAERQRLAREMHDSLGKTVNGIGLAAAALETAAAQGPSGGVRELAAEVKTAARTAADESRSLLRGLRRGEDDRPIVEQLGEMARSKSSGDLAIRVDVSGVADVARPLAREILAIAEEALDNVIQHSRGAGADVTLERESDTLRLTVTDDGRGFVLETTKSRREQEGHYGLRGMSERAEHTGGSFRVTSAPRRGTTVVCEWPEEQWKEAT